MGFLQKGFVSHLARTFGCCETMAAEDVAHGHVADGKDAKPTRP
jgi:hypothetical protein